MFTKSIKIAIILAILGLQLNAAFSSSLYFSKNVGQIKKSNGENSSDIQYVLNTNEVNCYFFNNKLSYIFHDADKQKPNEFTFFKYDVKFENTQNNIYILACNKLDNEIQYLQGNVKSKITNYEKLLYQNVYKNIDIEYFLTDNGLKYNIKVKPGGNPSNILSVYEGKLNLELKNNQLLINNSYKAITENIPEAYYYNNNGNKIPVQCKFILKGSNKVGFEVSEYDRTKELVIDPVVKWSTYIGSVDRELIGRADPTFVPFQYYDFFHNKTSFPLPPTSETMSYQTGGVFVTATEKFIVGSTFTIPYVTDFPELGQNQQNGWGSNVKGNYDIFVAKYGATSGSEEGELLKSCVFGGSQNDFGMDIAVNGENVYIVGCSNSNDFPTVYPPITTYQGGYDLVYIMLNSNLDLYANDFLYSSYIGGTDDDIAHSVTVDQYGHIAIVGETSSSNFPLTLDARQQTCSSCWQNRPDAFFMQINPTNNSYFYSTYIGGDNNDNALDVEFKQSSVYPNAGFYYIVGATKSSNFPLQQPIQSNLNNQLGASTYRDGFIHIIAQSTHNTYFSTYFGGTNEDILTSIAVYDYNNFVVLGGTKIVSPEIIDRSNYTYTYTDNIYPYTHSIINNDPYPLVTFNNPLYFPVLPNGAFDNNLNGNILIANFNKTTVPPGTDEIALPYLYYPVNSQIFGGSGMDVGNDIKIMDNYNIAFVGTIDGNNIKLKHSFQEHVDKGMSMDNLDVIVMRLNPSFDPIFSSLYRSGTSQDFYDNRASGIGCYKNDITFVGESFNEYIVHPDETGQYARPFTQSLMPDYYQDVFVTTLETESRLPTYLGTDTNDYIEDIYSELGYTYVTGKTQGRALPNVLSNLQGSAYGNYDIFLTKYDDINGMPIWSILYGGIGEDCGKSITKVGNHIYLTGYTMSKNLGYDYHPSQQIPQLLYGPTLLDPTSKDVFVMDLEENINYVTQVSSVNLKWFTYMGGNGIYNEQNSGGERIITDYDTDLSKQVLYVCGYACTDPIFTTNYSSTYGGFNTDGFIAKFDTTGRLMKSRWLGGINNESCLGLAKTYNQRIGVAGHTISNNFPVTYTGYQKYYKGNSDQFFTELSSNLDTLYSTYFGSTKIDSAFALKAEYLSTGPTNSRYSRVYIGGHQIDTTVNYGRGPGSVPYLPLLPEFMKATVNIFEAKPYSSGWQFKIGYGLLITNGLDITGEIVQTESYCYDLTAIKDTVFGTGFFKTKSNILVGNLDYLGLYSATQNDEYSSYVSRGLLDWSSSPATFSSNKRIGIGYNSTLGVGKAIARSFNPFSSDLQIIAGINTNASSLLDLALQSYPPYQATNNGLYDGFLVKLDYAYSSGTYSVDLFKEMIPQIESSSVPLVYPNPANDYINYSYQLNENAFIEIEIFDIMGNSVVKLTENKPKGVFFIPIEVNNLTSGMYLIRSKINNQIFSNKFVKY
jgi:hypothetical protein